MEFVKVSAYAEGYYSGQIYEEYFYISKKLYDQMEDWFNGTELYIGDLDGKHSEVEADIDIEFFEEGEDLSGYTFKRGNGDNLWYNLEWECRKRGINLDEDEKEVSDFIRAIDSMIEVEYRIKKSQKELVDNFVKSLQQ